MYPKQLRCDDGGEAVAELRRRWAVVGERRRVAVERTLAAVRHT